MKILAAILSQRWLVTTDWVIASNAANHFVDEKKYGFKLSEYLFMGKKFYITPKFIQANENNIQVKNCEDLIEYGKGKLVARSTDKRDFTIIADDEISTFKGKVITYNDLLNLIPQPPNSTGISNGFVEPLTHGKKSTDEEKENKLVVPTETLDTNKKNAIGRRKSAPYNTPTNKTSNFTSEAITSTEEYKKSSSKKKDTKNESTPLSTRKSGRHPKNIVFKVAHEDLDYEVEFEDNVNSDTDFEISSETKSSSKKRRASQKDSKTTRPKKKLKSDE